MSMEHLGIERKKVALYGIIDEKGNEVIAPEYDGIDEFYNMYRVRYFEKYGLRNYLGLQLLDDIYDEIAPINYSYLKVFSDNHYALFFAENAKSNDASRFLTGFVFDDIFLLSSENEACPIFGGYSSVICAKKGRNKFYLGKDQKFHAFV